MLNGRKPVGCISAVKLVGPVEVRGGLFQDVTLLGDAAVHTEYIQDINGWRKLASLQNSLAKRVAARTPSIMDIPID